MNGYLRNYTAQIRSLVPELAPEKAKTATEEILLRAASKPAFCFGAIAYADTQTILLEVATTIQKDLLADLLRGLETKIPVQIEQLGYGWILTGLEQPAITAQTDSLRNDPFAKVNPQDEAYKLYAFSRRGLTRFLLSLSLLLLVMAVSVMTGSLTVSSPDRGLVLAVINVVFWGCWILLDAPIRPWLYVSRVVCDRAGLEIKYWLKRAPIRLDWRQITGLDLRSSKWTLYFDEGRSRSFLASKELGLSEGPTLVKTIVQRASLHLVEVNIGLAIYRRFDAPE